MHKIFNHDRSTNSRVGHAGQRLQQYICIGAIGALLLASGCRLIGQGTPAPQDPQLTALSFKLTKILEKGKLPLLAIEPAKQIALLDPTYGVAADYGAWINNIRSYSHNLEDFHGYSDLELVKEFAGDPLNTPWRLDTWARTCMKGIPGPDSALSEAATLANSLPDSSKPASALPVPSLKEQTALELFSSTVKLAAEIVDKEALAKVSQDERELLRFVIPWICRSGGSFVNKSKGSPQYFMEMMFAPNDPFKIGDKYTAVSKTPVPAALGGMTGLNHYLHALAGRPLSNPIPFLVEAGRQPTFNCRIDFYAMNNAFTQLQNVLSTKALDSLRDDLQQHERAADLQQATANGITGGLIGILVTPHGRIILGGSGPNRYENVDALAILDIGGDDDYVYSHSEASIGSHPVQIIVDFSGDDVYQTSGVGGPGAGLLGIDILIDRAGNDRYCQGLSPLFRPRIHSRLTMVQPDPEGAQTGLVPFPLLYGNPEKPQDEGVALDAGFAFGAGFLGIGVLVDEAGDDLYLGQKFAFGCGFWHGVGVLHDTIGNDVYAAGLASIGAGINGAFGLLDDRSGDDHYQCLGTFESAYSSGQTWDNGYMSSGIGYGSSWRAEMRKNNSTPSPTLGGGLGLVHDGGGNDQYIGSSFGIAAAYSGGVGAIIDDGGNDSYFAKRGPAGDNHSGWSGNHAMGNGCHRGVGYLLDRSGNDRYSASSLGGGTSWDIASGFLLDLGGDDVMTDLHGKAMRGNTGWGAAKGFAVSFNAGGTDIYERSTFGDASSIGDGYPGKGGNFSFFFDVGTEIDTYPQPNWNNCIRLGGMSWLKESDGKEYPQGIGLFLDGPDVLQEP